jgi:hypothetical protein
VLLGTPLHASSNFTVSVQLANKRGFKQKNKKIVILHHLLNVFVQLANKRGFKQKNKKKKILQRQRGNCVIQPFAGKYSASQRVVGSELLTAEVANVDIFWDIVP